MGADEAAQVAHIEAYEALLNGLEGVSGAKRVASRNMFSIHI